jgi:hypothetical protein
MGRPVNKKYFGPLNTTGTDGYWNIPVNAYINGALHTNAYITSQSATNEFHVSTADGLYFAIARLTNKQPANLVLGEMCIMAIDSENNDYFIKKISNRTIIDFDNNKFTWALAESGAVTSMTITPVGEAVIGVTDTVIAVIDTIAAQSYIASDVISIETAFAFTGTNIVYTLSGAPAWATIDSSTGVIIGTVPATTSTETWTVTATNTASSATQTIAVDWAAAPRKILLHPIQLVWMTIQLAFLR